LQPSRSRVRVDLAIHVLPGRFIRGISQFLHQVLHGIEFLRT
jgi:hypothetical protein